MLVLSRRRDETIMIGDDVEITIVDIRGDSVRVGIKAPKHVSVHRKEIYEEIQAENITAAREQAAAVDGLGKLLGKPASAKPAGLDKLSGLLKPKGKSGETSGLDKLLKPKKPDIE